jgi:hypothetical protein
MPATTPPYFQTAMPAVSRPDEAPSSSTPTTNTLPIRKHKFPAPKIRLHLEDLSHNGCSVFLSHTKGNEDLGQQVQNVLNLLYGHPDSARPGTRSVTFILRSFEGIAYTTGTELDDDHKEIHLSTSFLSKIKTDPRYEILGVICHELVHCFQFNAEGTCPGGLIEGIADFVRLNAGLAARHWKQEAGGKWDAGYQHTAYFLQWLEEKFGDGTMRRLNAGLKEGKYDEKRLFRGCCAGKEVQDLWKEYGEELKKKEEKDGDKEKGTKTEEGKTIPTDTPPKIEGCDEK